MASRIVFLPKYEDPWYEEKVVTFEWVPGMAKSQARKSINNLHEAAQVQLELHNPLEISTKSNTDLGVSLSAFNLKLDIDTQFVSIESAYQSSKVFKNGGPYRDILNLNSYDAKKDERLKDSGELIGFEFEGNEWNVTNSPNFYDYLYIRALTDFEDKKLIQEFDCFTDIAFSQTSLKYKNNLSFNCQARSVAIYLGLLNNLEEYKIVKKLYDISQKNPKIIMSDQLSLEI
jgi:hypothetical protein